MTFFLDPKRPSHQHTAPSAPTGLKATDVSSSQINLSWTAPSNNGGSAITGYKIERSVNGGTTWSTIQSNTANTSTIYSDTGLAASTTYVYRVSAINAIGTSSHSNTASATTSGGTTTQITISVNSVDMSGNPITGMSTVIRDANGNTIAEGFTPASFTVTSGTTYVVHVRDYMTTVFNHWSDGTTNSYYTITPTQSVTLTAYYSTNGPGPTVTSAPQNLQATGGNAQVSLSWTAPSNDGGATITGYKIERSTDGGITWSTIVSSTGSTATTYSDSGLAASTTYTYRVSAINSAGSSSPSNTASATTNSTINQVQSGLVASDSLTNETETQQQLQANHGYWFYFGDAPAENAPYSFSRDNQGLHIGIQAPADTQWAGFYAESPTHNAQLWHAVITDPVRTTPSQFYDNGMYIQTYNGSINYVTCAALTNTQATVWDVVNATGNTTQVTKFSVLYLDNSPNQPLTRACTIITNGSNYLKVYLDGVNVYENHNMNLKMAAPFNAYLEPETSSASQMFIGTFQDYYVTLDENINMTHLPSNAARVDVVNSTGNVLATSQVLSGAATLNIGQYHFPLAATIKVYDSSNTLIASDSAKFYGGDVYSITTSSSATASSAPTGLTATAGNSQVSLAWTVPSSNGDSAITGYNIYRGTTSGGEGTTPIGTVSGSTLSYTDTGLTNGITYFYKVTAVNSVGESVPSNEASATPIAPTTQVTISVKSVDLSGNPITGMSVVIRYTNGTIISDTFTPASFTVTSGTTYVVHVRNYGTNVFNHWQDGTTNSYYTITPTQNVILTAYYSTS
ncbi:MAG TPA: fibronectin type III domain-containing protein [Nitrosopumilaceae archaeon]|nr:fibronectin type III domain-containing protein [Nitrosopumilaceae archaeon]